MAKGIGGRIRATVKNAADAARGVSVSALRSAADFLEGPQECYFLADISVNLRVDPENDTMWATQQQIADLFGKDLRTVNEHLTSAYRDGDIDVSATLRKFRIVRMEGDREVARDVIHYNLEAIFEVGRRTKSPEASAFRKWANNILREYVVRGYALNETRLRNDPEAAQSLADKVRELRYEEKNLYERVRNCVTMVASDYDGSSDQVRGFFARMQDKFHFAACEKTAQQLLLTRADGSKERMGMTVQLNSQPKLADAKVAKNYLSQKELKLQMLAGDAFFVYVENMIARERTMTTAQLLAKIDEVFKFNEMPEFPGYVGPYIKPQVEAHVKKQYELFKSRTAQERYDAARAP